MSQTTCIGYTGYVYESKQKPVKKTKQTSPFLLLKMSPPKADNLYLRATICKNDTVIDLGDQKDGYLNMLLWLLGKQGRLILFQNKSRLSNIWLILHKWLGISNITTMPLQLLCDGFMPMQTPVNENKHANVVDFYDNKYKPQIAGGPKLSLDALCTQQSIVPQLIKIDIHQNPWPILKGSMQVLQQHKPVLMLKCNSAYIPRLAMMELFSWLKPFGYRGYFLLDSLKISLDSFDFDLYQNINNNFYCDQFVFE